MLKWQKESKQRGAEEPPKANAYPGSRRITSSLSSPHRFPAASQKMCRNLLQGQPPTMHGHPSTHRRSGASIGLLLRQKVENCKDNGYLKMAPCDSPSKTGIETNLSGLITQVWSLTHIWQLVVVTDVTDVTDRHFQKLSRPPFYATFRRRIAWLHHGSIHSCSFSRRNDVLKQTTRST